MTRVQARATLLAIRFQEAIDNGLRRQPTRDAAIYEARELRREVRKALSR